MKAFISYSVSDNNEFIIIYLSSKLKESNFAVTSSLNFYSKTLDFNTMYDIETSHLFVGIITAKGNEKERVIEEWNHAKKKNIPNLVLLEDTVAFLHPNEGNILVFNRKNPKPAIDEIQRRMTFSPSNSNKGDVVSWILGGAAIIAVLSVLTGKRA